jgi:hypothetical protein
MNICAIATDYLSTFCFTSGLQRTATLVPTMNQGPLGAPVAASERGDVIDRVSLDTPDAESAHLTEAYAPASSPPPAQVAPYSSVEPGMADAYALAERVGASPADEPDPDQERGVVRLLMDGHFKGVADVRLRLNFFEQLNHDALPELRPPNGNGRAYGKFVQMYEERRGDAVDEVA